MFFLSSVSRLSIVVVRSCRSSVLTSAVNNHVWCQFAAFGPNLPKMWWMFSDLDNRVSCQNFCSPNEYDLVLWASDQKYIFCAVTNSNIAQIWIFRQLAWCIGHSIVHSVKQLTVYIICFVTGLSLVAVTCTILSQYLLNTKSYNTASDHRKQLFHTGLSSITAIGSAHTTQFKTLISGAANLRTAIEESVKLDQLIKAKAQEKYDLANKAKQQQQKPAIELKMNFGNFKWFVFLIVA